MGAKTWIRVAAFLLLSLAYILGSHWLMTQAKDSAWSVVALLCPMLVVIALGSWRAGNRWLAAAAAAVIAGLCLQALLGVVIPASLLYLGQHVGIHAFLALGFGATLRPGHTALITAMARRVHRVFTPEMELYTRKLTASWTLYFVAMAALSLLLYAFADFDTWALFANVLTPAAVTAMFVGEHWLRYRWHPDFERATFSDAIRSYMSSGKGGDSGGGDGNNPRAAAQDHPAA